MTTRTGVSGALLCRLSLTIAVLCFAGPLGNEARATVIVAWNFDNDIGQINSVATGTDSAHLTPSTGAGSGIFADGHHANSSTQWGAGVGNPSTGTAFLTQFWSVGDYWEFDVKTAGKTNLQLTFDQMGSGNGPRDFKVQTSTDGSVWTDVSSASYSLPFSVWKSEGGFSLPNNIVGIRIVDNSSTGVQGLPVNTTGRDWIDNVVLTGVAVPEPASLTLCGMAGAVALLACGGKAQVSVKKVIVAEMRPAGMRSTGEMLRIFAVDSARREAVSVISTQFSAVG